jgi:hypothetical protein
MKRLLFISIIAAFLLGACAASRALRQTANEQDSYAAPEVGIAPLGGRVEAPPEAAQPPGAQEAAAIERLVIQNADLTIVVADVDARMEAIEAMAVKMGGYVVSSNKYQSSSNNGVEMPEAQVVVRIPAERLDEALDAIKSDVVETQTESRSGQDVTADYVDQQSRLKNLEATEAQLVKILDEAASTEDVLNVFNQLTSIREQIELVKGQIKYYEESAALSAVTVRILAEASIQPIEIAGWKPQGVARDAIQDLIFFFQDFVNLLIRVVLLVLPALILIAIPFYLVFLGLRALVRKFRKPKAKPQVEPEASK